MKVLCFTEIRVAMRKPEEVVYCVRGLHSPQMDTGGEELLSRELNSSLQP